MSDRCELSDLPVDQCACRIHAPTQPAVDLEREPDVPSPVAPFGCLGCGTCCAACAS
jgi:hypothetical protein